MHVSTLSLFDLLLLGNCHRTWKVRALQVQYALYRYSAVRTLQVTHCTHSTGTALYARSTGNTLYALYRYSAVCALQVQARGGLDTEGMIDRTDAHNGHAMFCESVVGRRTMQHDTEGRV